MFYFGQRPQPLKGSKKEKVFGFNHQSPTVEVTVAGVKPLSPKGERESFRI